MVGTYYLHGSVSTRFEFFFPHRSVYLTISIMSSRAEVAEPNSTKSSVTRSSLDDIAAENFSSTTVKKTWKGYLISRLVCTMFTD